MSWQRVPLERSLGAYCADWDALNTRYYGGHPFPDSRFMEALLKYFGSGREQLFIHRSHGEIDGLVILRPRRFGIWQLFVPDQLQAAPMLIPGIELIDGLFQALPATIWVIELMNQDPDYIPLGLLNEGPGKRLFSHALTMNISLENDFDTYWAGCSRKLVQNIRRYSRRAIEAHGPALMQVLSEPEAMREAVRRYGELESRGWKGEAGTALNLDNNQGRFYAELMSRFAETGQAQVFEYKLGDQLVASRLVINSGGMLVMLKTTYDEILSSVAPGRLLLHALLERAFNEKRHKVVEFYTNATQDQLAWATRQRVISHVTCFRWPWLVPLHQTYQRLKPSGAGEAGETDKPDSFAVEVFEQVAELPKACKRLFEAGERDGFDLGSDWFELLARTAIPADAQVCFYVLFENGKVRCVLPLLCDSHGISGLTTFYTTLYRPLVAEGVQPDELAVVLRRVLRDTKASSIRFDAMDPEDPIFALMTNALGQAGLLPFSFFNFGNWYLQVMQMTWDDYLKLLPGKLRNTLKRLGKKFAEAGGQLKILNGSESDLDEALNAYQTVYSSSWKKPEPLPDFIPEFIRLCARKGVLRMGVAYMDNQPAAAQFWLVSHGKASIYKVAYDEKFSAYSIGSLLTGHLMQHVIEVDGVNEVDYLIGDDTYKKQWMSHRRERWGIVAYNSRTLKGLWGMLSESAKRRAKPLWISLRARITQAFPGKKK